MPRRAGQREGLAHRLLNAAQHQFVAVGVEAAGRRFERVQRGAADVVDVRQIDSDAVRSAAGCCGDRLSQFLNDAARQTPGQDQDRDAVDLYVVNGQVPEDVRA